MGKEESLGMAAILLVVTVGIAVAVWAAQSIDRAAIAAGLVQKVDVSGKVIWVKP